MAARLRKSPPLSDRMEAKQLPRSPLSLTVDKRTSALKLSGFVSFPAVGVGNWSACVPAKDSSKAGSELKGDARRAAKTLKPEETEQ